MTKFKLTPQLIEQHNIHFQRLSDRNWPPQYVTVFQNIYDTSQRRFEHTPRDLDSNLNSRLLHEAGLKTRARDLVEKANTCLSERANEAKWRFDTEPIVLFRFKNHIAW